VGVDVSSSIFVGANLRRSNFGDADVRRVDFREANLVGVNFKGAKFSGAKFSGANLSFVDFSGLKFYCVDFDGANLSDTNFSGAKFVNNIFGRANFSRANFTDAELRHADFIDSILYGAILTGADVQWARFGNRCGLDSMLFVIYRRENYAFSVESLRDGAVNAKYFSGANIIENHFSSTQSALNVPPRLPVTPSKPIQRTAQPKIRQTQKSSVVHTTKKTQTVAPVASQSIPVARKSVWNWISSVMVGFFGQFFRSIYRRFWRT